MSLHSCISLKTDFQSLEGQHSKDKNVTHDRLVKQAEDISRNSQKCTAKCVQRLRWTNNPTADHDIAKMKEAASPPLPPLHQSNILTPTIPKRPKHEESNATTQQRNPQNRYQADDYRITATVTKVNNAKERPKPIITKKAQINPMKSIAADKRPITSSSAMRRGRREVCTNTNKGQTDR